MKQIKFSIILENPILLTKMAGDMNTVESMDYITGTSILGFFAGLYLKDVGSANDEFYSIFFRDKVIFPNSYISIQGEECYPIPFSIQKKKDNPDKIYDLLITEETMTSPVRGFGNIEADYLKEAQINKTLHFHQERDRKKGFSKQGIIFNYQSIDEGQVFKGALIGEESYLQKLKSLISSDKPLYIGRSKTAQYGKVSLEMGEVEDFKSTTDTSKMPVTMTMLSDTILYNKNGFSEVKTSLMEEELGVKVLNSFVRKDIFENFISVWRAKKPMENVFKMGTCFLLDKLPEKYKDLEVFGIGERVSEGFGRVVFNLQNIGEFRVPDKEPPLTLQTNLTDLAKQILVKNIEDKIKEKIILYAYEDASTFNNNSPNNSLISRLMGFLYTQQSFEENLKKLREIAIKQLENCNNGNVTLREFLQKIDERVETHKKNSLKELNKFIVKGTDFNSDSPHLKKLYLKSFFTQMRRQNKTGG